jgi:hypothetical protein
MAKRPICRSASTSFPNFMMTMGAFAKPTGYRDSAGFRGVMGNKGNLLLGSDQVVPEMNGDPPNLIPRFVGQPVGGPVFNDTQAGAMDRSASRDGKGSERRPRASGRRRRRGWCGRLGQSLERAACSTPTRRDWIECIKSAQTSRSAIWKWAIERRSSVTSATCRFASAGATIHWDPEKEVVVGDKEAAAMCNKQYRAPWDGVLKSLLKV